MVSFFPQFYFLGLIDALEIFAGLIIFSDSKAEDKIRFLFDLFDLLKDLFILSVYVKTACIDVFVHNRFSY